MPVRTVPTGLDPPATLPVVSTEPVAVYVGQLHPHKGLDALFSAAALAPKLRLLIVGGGDWLAHWKRQVRQQGLTDRVVFSGHVPNAKVPGMLAQGRVGVLPLQDCFFNRYLTSPLKIMEYYAAGLPVVTADAPVTREVVEHEKTGLLVPFNAPEKLASALTRLCFDDGLHARCRDRIARRLPNLSWTRRGERIADFVQSLTSE